MESAMPVLAIAKDFNMFVLFVVSLLTLSFVCNSAIETTPHVTVNINNNLNSTNSNQNSNRSEITTIEIDTATRRFKTFLETDVPQHCAQLRSHFLQYKYHLCGIALASAYGILCYHLHRATQFIKYKTVWSVWHQELTMQELLACDLEKLTQELLIAIQMRYSNENNPTDFILPLVEFSAAIQKELDTLNFYECIYRQCKKYYLIKIVLIRTQPLEQLPEYIERTTYIQTLFKNWAAHHNLACQMQCHQPQSITQKIRGFLGI